MDMEHQVATESGRDIERYLPSLAGKGICRPTDGSKPGWALRDRDGFAAREPVLRRRLLEVADVLIPLLIAEQPAQAKRRLESAVDYRSPAVPTAFPREATGDVCVLGRVLVAGISGVTDQGVEIKQERAVVRLANLDREASMIHEVGGASNCAIGMKAHDLHTGDFPMFQMAKVKRWITPVGEEPVLHKPVVLVTR